MSGLYRRPFSFAGTLRSVSKNPASASKTIYSQTRSLSLLSSDISLSLVNSECSIPCPARRNITKICSRCLTTTCRQHNQQDNAPYTSLADLESSKNIVESPANQMIKTTPLQGVDSPSYEKQLSLWEEQQLLLDQKHVTTLETPLSESELKQMYEGIISISRENSNDGLEKNLRLKDVIEKLKPVLFDEQGDIHQTILTKVDLEAQRDDVINQALIVSRELGQKHLSLHIFNLLIYIYSLGGRSEQAAKVVSTIQEMGTVPNEKTYSFLMNAYTNAGDLKKTVEIFGLIHSSGLCPSVVSYGILIKAYAKHKRVEDAFDVYEKMRKLGLSPTQPIFGTLIQACIKSGQFARAWQTFDHMRLNVCQADPISFTLMLSACAKNGEAERAINLFEEMGEQGIVPGHHAFTAVISACSKRKDYYDTSLEILDRMTSQHGFRPSIYTLNVMLNGAQVCRKLEDARTFFANILALEDGTDEVAVAYTNLFFAYAKHLRPYTKKILELPAATDNSSTALVDNDIFTILRRPAPLIHSECVLEAKMVMQHMERVYADSPQLLLWPRVAYLLIHTNYCCFDDAMSLYNTYFADSPSHPNVYINVLSMAFKLRNADVIKQVWPKVDLLLAPLRSKSTLSFLEKKDYKAANNLSIPILLTFYRELINGFARMDHLELSFSLLEEMSKDFDLKRGLILQNFNPLYHKILDKEDQELKAKLLRLCPDPKGVPIIRAKATLGKKWSDDRDSVDKFARRVGANRQVDDS